MTNDYILYHKFTDVDSAEAFAKELKENGIDYHLEDNNHAYVKIVGYTPIEISVGLNIKAEDFKRADKILEQYYETQIKTIDPSYYLFEFTDTELKEIIFNPFDWGKMDYQLAKYILDKRGITVTDAEVSAIKSKKLNDLAKKEKTNPIKIFIGYALAVLYVYFFYRIENGIGFMLCFFLPIAIGVLGFSIKYNRKILPTGEKFYIHTDHDRLHGKIFLITGFISIIVSLLYTFIEIIN